jgi:hypothetical protein
MSYESGGWTLINSIGVLPFSSLRKNFTVLLRRPDKAVWATPK